MKIFQVLSILILCGQCVVYAGSGAGMAGSYYSNKSTIPAGRVYQPASMNFPGTSTPLLGAGVRYTPVSSKSIHVTNAAYNSNVLSINTERVNSYTKNIGYAGKISIALDTGKLSFSRKYDGISVNYNDLTRSSNPAAYNYAVTQACSWAKSAYNFAPVYEKPTWSAIIKYLDVLAE